MDGPPPTEGPRAPPPDPPAYVYAAGDIRPRQPREITLCARAADFDWMYTGSMALGLLAAEYTNIAVLKQQEQPGLRLIGPGIIGFFWGGFLSGGYLSLPKCDPMWSYGAPPEGAVRASWPMSAAITIVSAITAPALDFIFMGAIPRHWTVAERSSRVLIGMGAGTIGSLFPYLLPPKTWAAKREIERIRIGEMAGGPFVSYGFLF